MRARAGERMGDALGRHEPVRHHAAEKIVLAPNAERARLVAQ
jgi:hypothetical protein